MLAQELSNLIKKLKTSQPNREQLLEMQTAMA